MKAPIVYPSPIHSLSLCGVQFEREEGGGRSSTIQPLHLQGNQVAPASKGLGAMVAHPPTSSGFRLLGSNLGSSG